MKVRNIRNLRKSDSSAEILCQTVVFWKCQGWKHRPPTSTWVRWKPWVFSRKTLKLAGPAHYDLLYNCIVTIKIGSLMTNWRFTRGVEEQTKAFLDGFSEVVPLQWLQYFDEREIEVMTLDLVMVQENVLPYCQS